MASQLLTRSDIGSVRTPPEVCEAVSKVAYHVMKEFWDIGASFSAEMLSSATNCCCRFVFPIRTCMILFSPHDQIDIDAHSGHHHCKHDTSLLPHPQHAPIAAVLF